MDKGIFDFKKKIAFIAALTVISHSALALPVTEASAAPKTTASDTESSSGSGADEGTASSGTAEGAASSDAEEGTASGDGEGTAPDDETDEGDSASDPVVEKEYTITLVNRRVSDEGFNVIVNTLSNGKAKDIKPEKTDKIDGIAKGTFTSSEVDYDKIAERYGKIYIVDKDQSDDSNIVCNVFCKMDGLKNILDNDLPFKFTNESQNNFLLHEGEYYYRNNSNLTLNVKQGYIVNNDATISKIDLYITDNKTIKYSDKKLTVNSSDYTFGRKTISFDLKDDIKIIKDGQEVYYRDFYLDTIGAHSLYSKSIKDFYIECGNETYKFTTEDGKVSLSSIIEKLNSNGKIYVSKGKKVQSYFYEYGEETERFREDVDIEIEDGDNNKSNIIVPSILKGKYYCAGYFINTKVNTVSINNFVDECIQHEKIKITGLDPDQIKNIRIVYKTLPYDGGNGLTPTANVTKHADNVYAVNSSTPSTQFKCNKKETVIIYDYFNKDGGYEQGVAKQDNFSQMFTNKSYNYYRITDVIIKGTDGNYSSCLKEPIYVYYDKDAPTVSETKREHRNWINGSNTYELEIKEENKLPEDAPAEAKEAYKKIITALNKPGNVKSIIIGNYKFDQPSGGWTSGMRYEGVSGDYVSAKKDFYVAEKTYFEAVSAYNDADAAYKNAFDGLNTANDNVKKAEAKCNEAEEELKAAKSEGNSELDTYETALSNAEEALKSADAELKIAKIIESDAKSALTEKTTKMEAAKKEAAVKYEVVKSKFAELPSYYRVAETNEIENFYKSDISTTKSINDNIDLAKTKITELTSEADSFKTSGDYNSVPSLEYDNGKFKVILSAAEANKNSTFIDRVKLSAIDSAGNQSDVITLKDYKYDGTAPVIDNEEFKCAPGTNEKDVLYAKNGSNVSAVVTDKYSDGDASGVEKVNIEFVGVNSGEMKLSDNEDVYKYKISGFDQDESRSYELKFVASDKAGNVTDEIAGPKIIVDNIIPLSSITLAGANDDEEKWYNGFNDIKMDLFASDNNEGKEDSGIKELNFEYNDINENDRHKYKTLTLSDLGLKEGFDENNLKTGDLYVAFSQIDDKEYKAVLRGAALEKEVVLFQNKLDSKNKIDVTFYVVDKAGNSSDKTQASAWVDLYAPRLNDISTSDGQNIQYNITEKVPKDVFGYNAFSNSGTFDIVLKCTAASKIKNVDIELFDSSNNPVTDTSIISKDIDGERVRISFHKNFKGYMKLVLKNRVDVDGEIIYTNMFIYEKDATHNPPRIIIVDPKDGDKNVTDTNFEDKDGNKLYQDDVKVIVIAEDSFSGVENAAASIINRISNIIRNSDDNWEVLEREYNIDKSIQTTFTVSDNSNGYVVNADFTDNAGNQSDQSYFGFGIDKDDPEISVDINDGIYNTAKTANIRVKERNFDKDLVQVKVNGSRRSLEFNENDGNTSSDPNLHLDKIDFDRDGVYRIEADCKDRAGRSSKTVNKEITIDLTDPVITASTDQALLNNHYYSGKTTLTLKITEKNFDASLISISGTYNGSTAGFPKASGWTRVGDDHFSSITFARDGEYTISVTGKDKAGNELRPYNSTLCIDSTPPKLVIADVDKANSGTVRPTIRFTDTNLNKDTINITLEGAKRGKGLLVDGKFNNTSDGLEYQLNDFPVKQEYDDIYTLRATAKDNANNVISAEQRFSVNRFGSTFAQENSTKLIDGKYISKEQDVIFTEVNADKHSEKCTVIITKDSDMHELKENTDYIVEHTGGGDTWSQYKYTIFAKNFKSDAKYTVSIHSVDAAGNINISDSDKKKAELTFFVDKTKPLCVPININANSTYKGESYTAQFNVSDNLSLKDVAVYIDGEKVDVNRDLDNDECVFEIPNSKRSQNVRIVLTDMADNEIEYSYKNILVTTNVVRLMVRKTWFKFAGGAAILLAGTGAFLIRRRKKRLL